MTIEQRYEHIRRRLAEFQQSHLLRFWPTLSDDQRGQLLGDVDAIDFERCAPLMDRLVRSTPAACLPEQIDPPTIYPSAASESDSERYRQARQRGAEAIRAGKVAAFVVAGGQGTRLGYPGPKGAFAISPIRGATLFQLFAEQILRTQTLYKMRCPWYIMTSPGNHDETVAFFKDHNYFGLAAEDVVFFSQRQMPAFLPDGRIALAEPHRVALSPDGHGGSLWALRASGALDDMKRRGIEHLSYFQVDNPLVRVIDPLFVGLHLQADSEMSSKAVTKASDTERVGNFCVADGKLCVIEYSDLPESCARQRRPDGQRVFDAGSIAIHLLARTLIERLSDPKSATPLPWHRALKRVDTVDDEGRPVSPTSPNAVKLELFVFDAIPLARNPLVLYTERAEEFSPVKNAEGDDSPATARRDQIRRAARWLEQVGAQVPRDAEGEPATALEITPRFALDVQDLRSRLVAAPRIVPGQPLLLDEESKR